MRKRILALCAVLVLFAAGCATHIHTMGSGPQTGVKTEERQWYVLWGLVPINKVSTAAIAGDAKDYEIRTEASALDVVINIFTGWVTVYSRTVTITK